MQIICVTLNLSIQAEVQRRYKVVFVFSKLTTSSLRVKVTLHLPYVPLARHGVCFEPTWS